MLTNPDGRARNTVQLAADDIAAALGRIPGIRLYREAGAEIEAPAVAIALPRIEWNGPTSDPTDATFVVGVIATTQRVDTLNEDLTGWVIAVTDALHEAPELSSKAAIRSASPGTWPNGGTELPAFLIEIEVAV